MLSYRPSFGAPSGGRLIRLSANEGALGCSPKALEALQKSVTGLSRYPEIQDHHLNEAIAERYNLDAGRILTSNGSDELISLITLAYLEPGDEVVTTALSFAIPVTLEPSDFNVKSFLIPLNCSDTLSKI